MASVQQLHTADPAAQATAQQSESGSQSHSAASNKRPRAASLSIGTASEVMQQANPDDCADGATSPKLSASDHPAALSAQHATQALAAVSVAIDKLATTAGPSQAAGQADPRAKGKLTSVKEYFVKWKGKSFLHCSWVRHDDVLKVASRVPGLNMRFKHYQRSVYGMPEVSHFFLRRKFLPP